MNKFIPSLLFTFSILFLIHAQAFATDEPDCSFLLQDAERFLAGYKKLLSTQPDTLLTNNDLEQMLVSGDFFSLTDKGDSPKSKLIGALAALKKYSTDKFPVELSKDLEKIVREIFEARITHKKVLLSTAQEQKEVAWAVRHFDFKDYSYLNDYIYLPDSDLFIGAKSRETIAFFDTETHERREKRFPTTEIPERYKKDYQGQISNIALSPDGKLLATSFEFGVIRIWDVETLQEKAKTNHSSEGLALRMKFLGNNGPLLALFNTNGKSPNARLIHLEKEPTIEEINIPLWNKPKLFFKHLGNWFRSDSTTMMRQILGMSVSHNQAHFALRSSHDTSRILIYDSQTQKPLHDLRGTKMSNQYVAWTSDGFVFSHDNKLGLERDIFGGVSVWDLKSGKILKRLIQDDSSPIKALGFMSDPNHIVLVQDGLALQIVDWRKETVVYSREIGYLSGSQGAQITYSKEGTQAVLIERHGQATVYKLELLLRESGL